MKRTLALAALVIAGCGGDHTPPRPVERVVLARPPLVDALGKQAAIARVASGDLGPVLDRLKTQPTLNLPSVTRGGVTLHDVAVRRRGDKVAGEASISEDQLAGLAPGGIRLRYEPGGPGITLKGSKQVLGVDVPVVVHVVAENGAVVAKPENLPVGPTVLFSDPRVHVDGVAGRRVGGGIRLRGVATLR